MNVGDTGMQKESSYLNPHILHNSRRINAHVTICEYRTYSATRRMGENDKAALWSVELARVEKHALMA